MLVQELEDVVRDKYLDGSFWKGIISYSIVVSIPDEVDSMNDHEHEKKETNRQ